VKRKGERERHIQLNAEFQRISRRDKKDFFNEKEENMCMIVFIETFRKCKVIY